MQGAFLNAVIYQPPCIYGVQLLPFSCWHGLVLEEMKSSYIVGGVRDINEAISVLWVCSHKYEDGLNIAAKVKELKKLGKRIKPSEYQEVVLQIDEYIRKSISTPEVWRGEKENKRLKAPIWWHLVYFGIKFLGLSEIEAWNYSFLKLFNFMMCECEYNGSIDLVAEDEMEFILSHSVN